ncbi:cytochrome P450 family protein [Hyaloraphidium curvatum]|nr:cytochrome P450 family protein [Hyaloraphidium curvatum]
MDPKAPIQGMMRLAEKYGPIYKLELFGDNLFLVTSYELAAEVSDETRFQKRITGPLQSLRDLTGNGLANAETEDPLWGKAGARRILAPAFGPAGLANMFEPAHDIVEQLMLKWERMEDGTRIDLLDSTTRVAIDTVGLSALGFRFNSLYSEKMHPFVAAISRVMGATANRAAHPALMTKVEDLISHQYRDDISLAHRVADDLIAHRRAHPEPDKKDALNAMLYAQDPKTGETLPDENIRFQIATFFIAGGENTAGLMSIATHFLLQNPDALARAREEVDRVLGAERPRFDHLAKLTFIDKVLKETVRLWPTTPGFAVFPREEETLIGGQYLVRNTDSIYVLSPTLHRDPRVFKDPLRFDPERFTFENASKIPAGAYKPFGNGGRICIGRPLALMESTLFLAMMLRRFDVAQAEGYKFEMAEALGLRPAGLFINVKRRDTQVGTSATAIGAAVQSKDASPAIEAAPATGASSDAATRLPMTVAFGSNAGSAEDLARRIAAAAPRHGYAPTVVPLDALARKLAKDAPLVVVTASYEGLPPENAAQFVAWLDKLEGKPLEGLRYAVYGAGNSDWARTFQSVPIKVDRRLEELGGTRITARGESDAHGDFFGAFDAWIPRFWPSLAESSGLPHAPAAASAHHPFEIEFLKEHSSSPVLRYAGMPMGMIVANRELVNTAAGGRSKRHVEIALPRGMTYRAGDYLAVLPLNPSEQVDRALQLFSFAYDAQVVIRADVEDAVGLPVGKPVSVGELLSAYVELSAPATKTNVAEVLKSATSEADRAALADLAGEGYESKILAKRLSLLDLLEKFPSAKLGFAEFIHMLPALKQRQYSISSSPLWSPSHCTLTVAVLDAPHLSGSGRRHRGSSSTHLASLRPGSMIPVEVRPSRAAFHPPPVDVPAIMVCAGTGFAPFRGFLQDRALRAAQERKAPAPTLLFVGCDAPDVDFIYREELEALEKQGIVSLRPAFSSKPEISGGAKYVQNRLWNHRSEVAELVKAGADFFLCGDARRLAPAVRAECLHMYREATGAGEEEAEKWLATMEREKTRYVADVFA